MLRFEYDLDSLYPFIEKAGHSPLPPYIMRESTNSDKTYYQTVFASERGSVAAPTAGIHFSKDLLTKFEQKGVKLAYITLHIGLGTFRPIMVEDLTRHQMDSEYFHVPLETAEIINHARTHKKGAIEIAQRSRGTPRIANRILRRARDFAQIKSDGIITLEVAKDSLKRLGIDENGLDDMDHRILTALVNKFNGGPVGVESLGVAISEDARTIEEVYEPYLIKEGFIQRTAQGRKALDKTFTYLKVRKPNEGNQFNIF